MHSNGFVALAGPAPAQTLREQVASEISSQLPKLMRSMVRSALRRALAPAVTAAVATALPTEQPIILACPPVPQTVPSPFADRFGRGDMS